MMTTPIVADPPESQARRCDGCGEPLMNKLPLVLNGRGFCVACYRERVVSAEPVDPQLACCDVCGELLQFTEREYVLNGVGYCETCYGDKGGADGEIFRLETLVAKQAAHIVKLAARTTVRPRHAFYRECFVEALERLCRRKPPVALVTRWLDETDNDLQDWAATHSPREWMTGIGVLDAAESLAASAAESGYDLKTYFST